MVRSLLVEVAAPKSDLDGLIFVAVVALCLLVGRRSSQVKLLCFGADDSDASGCRYLLEDVVAGIFPIPAGFQMKIHVCGLGTGDAWRRNPLKGIVVEQ